MQGKLAIVGLGMVPGAARKVTPVPQDLLALVPLPTDNNRTYVSGYPDVEKETIPLIVEKARRCKWQVKKLAARLQGKTLPDTLRNISNFILKHIAYKQDTSGHEEVRSPRRLVHEAIGDCDCYAVFIASVLLNLNIKFRFRLARYKSGEWTHIYIVVPKNQNNNQPLTDRSDYYVIDPVTNTHDYEVPPTKKRDYTMALKFLDGLGAGYLAGCTDADKTPLIKRLRRYVDARQVQEAGLVPTRVFLTENKIPFTEAYDAQKESGYFVIDTPTGKAAISPIITQDEADVLKPFAPAPPTRTQQIAVMDVARAEVTSKLPAIKEQIQTAWQTAQPVVQNTVATAVDASKKFPWGWLLLGAGTAYALWPKKKKPTLAGVKASAGKVARL